MPYQDTHATYWTEPAVSPRSLMKLNTTAKDYKEYWRRILENKEIDKFLEKEKHPKFKAEINNEFFDAAEKEFEKY